MASFHYYYYHTQITLYVRFDHRAGCTLLPMASFHYYYNSYHTHTKHAVRTIRPQGRVVHSLWPFSIIISIPIAHTTHAVRTIPPQGRSVHSLFRGPQPLSIIIIIIPITHTKDYVRTIRPQGSVLHSLSPLPIIIIITHKSRCTYDTTTGAGCTYPMASFHNYYYHTQSTLYVRYDHRAGCTL